MNWTDIMSAGGAVAIPFSLGIWALIEWRGRRVWAPKKLEEDHAETARLANANEDRLALLEQAQVHQAEMLEASVVKPLEKISGQMDKVVETQETHGREIVALSGGQTSLGRSLDDLRGRMDREMP